jgi:hypothetical protein
MAIAFVGVRLRGTILARQAHFAADTLSRLEPADLELSCPRTSVNSEIPCFSVQDPDVHERTLQNLDLILLPLENFLEEQESEILCRQLSMLVGANPSIDFDEFGAVGHVLPSGELQLGFQQPFSGRPRKLSSQNCPFLLSNPLHVFEETLHT